MRADIVLTSHPEMADVLERQARRDAGKPNPFIDPTTLPALVAEKKAAFEAALADALKGE
jgi:metallo-beta-lactamase class B